MPTLIDYSVEFGGTIITNTVVGSYNISGGPALYDNTGTYGIKTTFEDINHSDFRWIIRVSIVTDTTGKGTADIKYVVSNWADNDDTVGSVEIATNMADSMVAGSVNISGGVFYDSVVGSFVMLAQVVKLIGGSFNITTTVADDYPTGGSFNVGNTLIIGEDTAGSYNLYAVIDGVLIKIDIIPDEIKQALIIAGVKFD